MSEAPFNGGTSGREELRVPHSRTGAAFWLAAAGALAALLMLVFIIQNGQRAELNFLWIEGSPPVGVALLLAAVIGALIVLTLGAARILQLRLVARRHRRNVDAPATQV